MEYRLVQSPIRVLEDNNGDTRYIRFPMRRGGGGKLTRDEEVRLFIDFFDKKISLQEHCWNVEHHDIDSDAVWEETRRRIFRRVMTRAIPVQIVFFLSVIHLSISFYALLATLEIWW